MKRFLVAAIMLFALTMAFAAFAEEDINYLNTTVSIHEIDMPIPGTALALYDGRFLALSQYTTPYIYEADTGVVSELTAYAGNDELWFSLSGDEAYRAACQEEGVLQAWHKHIINTKYRLESYRQKGDYVFIQLTGGNSFMVDLNTNEIYPYNRALCLLDGGRMFQQSQFMDYYTVTAADGTEIETFNINDLFPDCSIMYAAMESDMRVYLLKEQMYAGSGDFLAYYVAWHAADGTVEAMTWIGDYNYPRSDFPEKIMLLEGGNTALVWYARNEAGIILARKDGGSPLALKWDGTAITAIPIEPTDGVETQIGCETMFYPIGASKDGKYAAFWCMEGIVMMNCQTLESAVILDADALDAYGLSPIGISGAMWNGGNYMSNILEYMIELI